MQGIRTLFFALGTLLLVLGVSGVAFSQDDACGLIIKRDPGTGQVFQFGCPTGNVCLTSSGSTTCTPGYYVDTYMNQYMVCRCADWRGTYIGEVHVGDDYCVQGFLPWDAQDPDGPGSPGCFPESCQAPCDYDWVGDWEDPELERYMCECP